MQQVWIYFLSCRWSDEAHDSTWRESRWAATTLRHRVPLRSSGNPVPTLTEVSPLLELPGAPGATQDRGNFGCCHYWHIGKLQMLRTMQAWTIVSNRIWAMLVMDLMGKQNISQFILDLTSQKDYHMSPSITTLSSSSCSSSTNIFITAVELPLPRLLTETHLWLAASTEIGHSCHFSRFSQGRPLLSSPFSGHTFISTQQWVLFWIFPRRIIAMDISQRVQTQTLFVILTVFAHLAFFAFGC